MQFKAGDIVICRSCEVRYEHRKGEWCLGRLGTYEGNPDGNLYIARVLENQDGDGPGGVCAFWPEHCTKLEPREYIQYLL